MSSATQSRGRAPSRTKKPEITKAGAAAMLEQLIPFPEWLMLAPRTLGDIDLYAGLAEMLACKAAGRKRTVSAESRSMAVSDGLDDEEAFFRFNDAAHTEQE